MLDSNGRLYYTAANTRRQRLAATAIAATWLSERLEDSRARRQIVVLDCCHSGAFARGTKGDPDLALQQRFEPHGRGRVVLTASRSTEYSFEGGQASGEGVPSVFTHAIVNGLRTGEADRDKDGLITVTDLYQYVYDNVRSAEPRQTPELWTYGAEGNLLVAHSVRGAVIEPEPLPEDLRVTLESPRRRVRETGVAELADLLDAALPGVALAARRALERIAEEDHPQVAELASIAVTAPGGAAADQVRRELTERAHREERARQEKARREAEDKARREAEDKARREAEDKARREAEDKARREAEDKARREAEDKARREAEDKARREAEDKARREAEDKARREAEDKARREAEDKARREAEDKARREAEDKARREAEDKARRDTIPREIKADSRVDKSFPSPPAPGSELGEEAPQPLGLRIAGRVVPRRRVFIATGAAIAVIGLLTAIIIIATPPTPLPTPYVRWRHTTGDGVYGNAGPAVAGGTVYFGNISGKVWALDAATGHRRWRYTTGGLIDAGPAVAGGTVYVGSYGHAFIGAGKVYALDAATGHLRWSYTTGSGVPGLAVAGGTVYAGSRDGKVYALDAATGHLRWSRTTGDSLSAPAVAGGTVYVATFRNNNKVYALDAATGHFRWSQTTGDGASGPAVAGGTVYVASDRKVYALDAATGHLRWSYTTGGPVSDPAVAGGTVCVGSNRWVYALDAATGHLRWSYTTGGRVTGQAVAGGTVYAGSVDHKVYALDAATGHPRWSYTTGELASGPAVAGGTVYVASWPNDNKMYALDARL